MESTLNENLITENMKLVHLVIRNMGLKSNEDLIQEGMMGLCKAAKHFNDKLGFSFCTYAYATIRGQIKLYIRTRANLVKPIRHIPKTRGEKESLEFANVSYLDDDLMSLISNEEDSCEESAMCEDFINNYLTETEQFVIRETLDGKTQLEIGKKLGVTQTQVHRIIVSIRGKYRKYSDLVKVYIN